jgi:hypothetical protein
VSFTASGNCTLIGGATVHLTGAGSCTITAKQTGDTNYNPAPDVPQIFSIAKANQTITFGALGNKTFGDADFGVSATATSSLGVSFHRQRELHTDRRRDCAPHRRRLLHDHCEAGRRRELQSGSRCAADFLDRQANQTITFGALGDKTFGDADFGVSATASSTLA